MSHSGEVLLGQEVSGVDGLVLGLLALDEVLDGGVSVEVVEEGHGLAAAEGDSRGTVGLLGRDDTVQGGTPLKRKEKTEKEKGNGNIYI